MQRSAATAEHRSRPIVADGLLWALVWTASLALVAIPIFTATRDDRHARFAGALGLTGVALLSYCIVAGTVRHSGSPWLAVLRSRTLTFFGLISYCLYIVNGYVVSAYDRFRGPMQVGNMRQYFVRAVCVLAIATAICVVSPLRHRTARHVSPQARPP